MKNKIKILFMDDDPTRHDIFSKQFSEYTDVDLTQTTLVESTIMLLQNEKWDMVYLDHDMGNDPNNYTMGIYGNKIELCGQDVARAIAKLPLDKQPGRVIIHSWNVVGSKAMFNILLDANINVIQEPFNPNYFGIEDNRETGG
jgi:CheY-like chemotaxis protein